MGLGDNLMATGMARGAKDRGKRIAFGNGKQILWDQHSEQVFSGNANVARPGSEADSDVEWIPFYKGNRLYNKHDPVNKRWIWNYDFKPIPGEVFFTEAEEEFGAQNGSGVVVIEPNLPHFKSVAPNKQWPQLKYSLVASRLAKDGYHVCQFNYRGAMKLHGVRSINCPSFRHALAVMKYARLYVGPEGGLHHGAAAVGIPGVVLFGGFIPPQVTGYDTHTNLTGGAKACGSLKKCRHCVQAMTNIHARDVVASAMKYLRGEP